MRTVCARFTRGTDLYGGLAALAKENGITASAIVSLVGCVSRATIRAAGAEETFTVPGPLEIVSATGTVSRERIHVHAAFSDRKLNVFGGHMKEGCTVDTTAEVVLLVMDDTRFSKAFDESTGYNELRIESMEADNGR